MLVSLAWRNVLRNRWLSILTGSAVAFGVVLIVWMRGFQDGSYAQMIDQAVRTRIGHIQVVPPGYLDDAEPAKTIIGAEPLRRRIAELSLVHAVSPRAVSEGMLSRDSEAAPADLLGVSAEDEQRASVVDERLLEGDEGEEFCRRELGRAVEVMGGDQELFDRWCTAARSSRYLPSDEPRAAVIGSGLAKRLLVSVDDEITVQVVRARSEEGEGGEQAGSLSQRRLVVTGIVRTGNPEIDERVAYVHIDTLTAMLGTDEPNELVVLLNDIRDLEPAREQIAALIDDDRAVAHTWYEKNPALKALIDTDSGSGNLMYFILVFLVALVAVNTTFMSVARRTREFGVMLALGATRARVFTIVMAETALLGGAAVAFGAVLGGALEAFGRSHGWPIEWFGGEEMSSMQMSGAIFDPIYYSALTTEHAAMILIGVYAMFLASGVLPALKVARTRAIDAMQQH